MTKDLLPALKASKRLLQVVKMAAMSLLKIVTRNVAKNGFSFANQTSTALKPNVCQTLQMSGHKTMAIRPSRWQWLRFKDLVHFYIMLGVIPATVAITCINIFIGPAKLVEIPEGYVPEAYEYHSHPITRWMAKHVCKSYQQEYEMYMQYLFEEEYKMKLRQAEKRVNQKMLENQDVQTYFYGPVTPRYHEFIREANKDSIEQYGSK
nr:EOG090X0FIE [Eurycercus lamellatus]